MFQQPYITHTLVHAGGSGDFVFLTLNEPAIIDCTTPEDVDQVQWLDDDDNIPHFPGLTIVNKRLTIVNVTEIFHNQTFQCKELNNNGDTRFAQLYRLIVSSELQQCCSLLQQPVV